MLLPLVLTFDEDTKSVCIWANELRVTDFDTRSGTAANATLNLKMADFANITASTRYTSFGFGGVQTKIADRTRDYSQDYDLAGSFFLDRFFPESLGLQLPMYLGYQKTTITKEYCLEHIPLKI